MRVASDGLDKVPRLLPVSSRQCGRAEELIDDEPCIVDVAAKKSDLTGIRVLVVDDERDSIEIVGLS